MGASELMAAIIEANIGRRYERFNDGHPPRKGRNQVSGSLAESVTCLFIGLGRGRRRRQLAFLSATPGWAITNDPRDPKPAREE